ncbi:phosphatidylglycerol lysyltransferase [Bacillus sp. cl95]|uniref:bifunctional lysylphosphatidylglycerol flippase/synthetase MprF n=1 Tax=Bacillus sp. UNCCL13 TaxID=1502772 RepID=UPI0008ECA45D|nr:bifunctional lysylphosphatidylglycerol flippase/synthetase MprF [Bacillus sp. UNCCL13]SFA70918.1 phosphatidylglycerol lysyltransferase [Bacillus sp. UNCCL13]SFQ60933.1 phosphatidylglycerol lysyltransferase [Bacillus sp. cl95]
MSKTKKLKWLSYLKVLIPAVLLIVVIIGARRFFEGINGELLKKQFDELSFLKLTCITLLGFLAVSPMILYDFVFSKKLGLQIGKKQLIPQSYIFNTFSNFIGFGGFAGAALRTYFYQRYNLERRSIIKEIAKLSFFYLSGMSLLCWLILMGVLDSSLLVKYRWLKLAVLAIALYLPVVLISLSFTKQFDLRRNVDRKYIFQLISTSTVEWLFAFMAIYGIGILLGEHIPILEFLSIFIIATCAGVMSMIPGGLGSFDFMVLIGLESLGLEKETILLMILLYRFSYYVFPFFVSFIVQARYLWGMFNRKWTNLPNIVMANISHVILTVLVFLAGFILLFSASVPGIFNRLSFMKEVLSAPIMNLSHQLSIAAGISLLGLARGIEYRVKRAYFLTIGVLIAGSLFTFSKGFDYEEAIFILLVAWGLWLARHRFYREDFVHTWGKFLFDTCIILLMLGFYFFIGYVNLPSSNIKVPVKLQEIILINPYELFRSGMIGLIIASTFLLLGFKIDMPSFKPKKMGKNTSMIVREHLIQYKGTVLSHLLFLYDKYVHWSTHKDVLFGYQIYADKIVVLGNPVGEKASIHRAMEEFREEADKFGYTPIYYQVSKEMLPYLHENGYDFFKLGEEGYVQLKDFTLSGKRMKNLRAVRNKLEREGILFSVNLPPFDAELLHELKEVSEIWLDGRKEKGFSLGYFDEEYINLTPVAIIRDANGKLLAFSTLMPVYDQNKVISIDLMRYVPDSPSGTMDYMFMNLLEWAKQEGYVRFNLGMAPLSNVGISKYAFLGERIASQIYSQGHFLYQFQGVRRFKEKYADEWEPKYLAYKKKSSLFFTMMQVTLLISKKKD